MTYAVLGRAPGYMSRGYETMSGEEAPPDISIGRPKDAIVSRATLIASEIVLKVSTLPPAERGPATKKLLQDRGIDPVEVAQRIKRLKAKGQTTDQATFDAMRVAISNQILETGLDLMREAVRQNRDPRTALSGLGDDTARDVGCTVLGIGGAIGGALFAVFAPQGASASGSQAIGAGTGLAAQGMNCNARQRQAESNNAAAAERQAALNLQAAQVNAQAAAAQAANMNKYLIAGGIGVVVILGAIVALR